MDKLIASKVPLFQDSSTELANRKPLQPQGTRQRGFFYKYTLECHKSPIKQIAFRGKCPHSNMACYLSADRLVLEEVLARGDAFLRTTPSHGSLGLHHVRIRQCLYGITG